MPRPLLDILPLELWDKILGLIDDPIDLWRSRSVCRQFQHSATRTFQHLYLPAVELEILTQTPKPKATVLTFDRLCLAGSRVGGDGDGRKAALFTCLQSEGKADGAQPVTTNDPRARAADCDRVSVEATHESEYHDRTRRIHYIRLLLGATTIVNDTALPHFTIHAFNPLAGIASISVDWVAAMNCFFHQDVFMRHYRLKFWSSDRIMQVYYCARSPPKHRLAA